MKLVFRRLALRDLLDIENRMPPTAKPAHAHSSFTFGASVHGLSVFRTKGGHVLISAKTSDQLA